MGRVNPIPGQGMAVRVVLLRADGSDGPTVPGAAYDGEVEHEAGSRWYVFRRSDDRVFALYRVAVATVSGTRYVLAVAFTPGTVRDATAPFLSLVADFGADLVKSWPVVQHADGTLRCPALDSDGTAIGNGVKANLWPAGWRLEEPPASGTFLRYVAHVLA